MWDPQCLCPVTSQTPGQRGPGQLKVLCAKALTYGDRNSILFRLESRLRWASRFLTSAVGMATSPGTSGGVAGVPRICSRLPQPLRRAPAPQARVGGGGYSQLRSYFHTPFASPSARRSPPPPPPRPPPLAPGRRPFFTTSQPPGPAALADMTSAPLPPGFPARTAFPGCHVVAAAAAKQPGIRSPSAPPRGGSGERPAAARPRPCG